MEIQCIYIPIFLWRVVPSVVRVTIEIIVRKGEDRVSYLVNLSMLDGGSLGV